MHLSAVYCDCVDPNSEARLLKIFNSWALNYLSDMNGTFSQRAGPACQQCSNDQPERRLVSLSVGPTEVVWGRGGGQKKNKKTPSNKHLLVLCSSLLSDFKEQNEWM